MTGKDGHVDSDPYVSLSFIWTAFWPPGLGQMKGKHTRNQSMSGAGYSAQQDALNRELAKVASPTGGGGIM